MKIKKIQIHNWRSIGNLELEFETIMIFIGQNNHGKSNVLSALLFFFGEIACTDLDFKKGNEDLFVEVEFSDLDEHDKGQFKKYLTSTNTIKVRKQMSKGSSFEYHGYCEIPTEEWLKEENCSNYIARTSINGTPLVGHVPDSGRITKDMIKEAQRIYIEENRAELRFNYEMESTNFLGLKTVAQGIFGDVYFIPAVKDAGAEFQPKGKSIFNKLLSNVINDMSSGNRQYKEAKEKIKELTKNLNKSTDGEESNNERPEQLSNLERAIGNELTKWNTKIDIEITPPDIDEALKVGTNVWVDDGVPTDVSRKGHGLQRALIFALFKAWASISQNVESANKDSGASSGSGRGSSASKFFIFEEPELYLHPQAQKELYSSLNELSALNNQVLLSTHSSSFINIKKYKSICIIYKNNVDEGSKGLQYNGELFDTEGEENKNFNLSYWVNPDRGELFFAKKIILVEGPTDKTVIPFLAKKLSKYRYDYSIIDCGGKDNIKIYIHLLNKFKLHYLAVYDKDHQDGKNFEQINSADKSSLSIENKIDRSLGSSIILENDIEEEIGIVDASDKNKPYIALKYISNADYEIVEQIKGKIEQIYS